MGTREQRVYDARSMLVQNNGLKCALIYAAQFGEGRDAEGKIARAGAAGAIRQTQALHFRPESDGLAGLTRVSCARVTKGADLLISIDFGPHSSAMNRIGTTRNDRERVRRNAG